MTAYAIQKTLAQYCQSVDDGRIDDLARLFAEDAVLIIDAFDIKKKGRDAIRDQYRQMSDPTIKGTHCAFNPVIDIVGNAASGSFDYLWVNLTQAPRIGIGGRYRIRFTLSGERWLIQEMNVELRSDPSFISA